MTENREHVVPIHPVKGLFSVGTNKYAGDFLGLCYLDEVEDLDGIVPRFSGGNEPHLV